MATAVNECIALVMEAAQVEAAAMDLDKQGKAIEAVASYRQAADGLQKAAAACPSGHPDGPVLEQHRQEVLHRAVYLEGLPAGEAPVPLETHINGVELTMAATDDAQQAGAPNGDNRSAPSGFRTMGAAAAVGGAAGMMFLRGPVGGLIAAAGAAYATTRSDKVGDVARSVGQAGVSAVDKAKQLDQQHQISEKAKAAGTAAVTASAAAASKAKALNEEHQLTEKAKAAGTAAVGKAQALDEQLKISENAKKAASQTATKLNELNDKHKVTEKLGKGLSSGLGMVAGWLSKGTAEASTTSASGSASTSASASAPASSAPAESASNATVAASLS